MEKKHEMQEELTTAMHAEFMEGEMSARDLAIVGCSAAVERLRSLSAALKEYGLNKDEFIRELPRALGYPENEFEEQRAFFLKNNADFIDC